MQKNIPAESFSLPQWYLDNAPNHKHMLHYWFIEVPNTTICLRTEGRNIDRTLAELKRLQFPAVLTYAGGTSGDWPDHDIAASNRRDWQAAFDRLCAMKTPTPGDDFHTAVTADDHIKAGSNVENPTQTDYRPAAPARTPKPLFDVADYVPKHHAKKLKKTKKAATTKATAHNAKFDDVTKPVRLPVTWSREELTSRIELLHSALYTAEEELAQAKARSGGQLSNRFEKLAALVRDLRKAWPAGDVYDPFRE